MKKIKRIFAFCCAVVLGLSLCPISFAAVNAPTSEGDVQPYNETNHPYDISVMTFNILGDNSGTARYDTPANRVDRVVGLIENYEPDVVNLQEAYMNYYVDAAKTVSWHDILAEKLTVKGYSYVSPANIEGATAAKNSALMIFYKTARFTKGESGWGSLQVEVTYKSYTGGIEYSKDRAYIWVELADRYYRNNPVYIYNTHFPYEIVTDKNGNTIPTDDISTSRKWISSLMHGEQAKIIANSVKSVAGNNPFFISGDFNTGLDESYSDKYFSKEWGGEWNSLLIMRDTYSAIQPAVRVAKRVLNTDIYGANKGTAWTGIDHIFVNNDMLVTTDYQTLMDHVDGRRPSDHLPRMAYFSYRPALTANVGEYDKWEGTYEHTVASNTLTLNLTLPAGVTYSFGDNAVGNNTLMLNRHKNTFDIKLYNNGDFYDTVYATVYNTAATRPTLNVTGAKNVYFANHAYQVAVEKETEKIVPQVSGGTLYTDGGCTTQVTELTPAAGRTELCLKSDSGEYFPVYIYKETAAADTKTVYIEDDTKDAEGTVAFYDGTDVILGTAGVNVFGDFPEALGKFNDGTFTTAVFAGGHYSGNNDSRTTGTPIGKDVVLLGNNADIEANLRENAAWQTNPARKEETVIHGAFRWQTAASDTASLLVSASGFTFVDQANFGSVFVDEKRGEANYTTVLNVCNNIFSGATYQWNGAAIYINNAPQKTGVVKGNLFMTEGNLVLSEYDSNNYGSLYYRRGIFGRNINGLTIENNRFMGFLVPLWLSSEAASGNTTTAAYATYTVKGNRFEKCDHLELYVQNVSSATTAHIKLIDNDFLRCGSTGLDTVYLQYIESGVGVDFAKCSLELTGNNFNECIENVYVSRTKNDANAMKMPLSITGNRFIPNDQHNQRNYLGKTLHFSFGLGGSTPTHWNLKNNYFSADYYLQGDEARETNNNYITPDVHDPALFINTGGAFTLARSQYAPYYADYAMTELICDHQWESDYTVDTEATCATAGSKSIRCKDCNVQKDGSVTAIPATGNHTAGELITDTAATCMAKGVGHKNCTICGQLAEGNIEIPLNAENHTGVNHTENAKDATCVAKGYTGDTVCECGAKLQSGETIGKKQHTAGAWTVVKEATTKAEGLKEQRCTICNTLLKSEIIAKKKEEAAKVNFTDVKKSDFFFTPVQWAVANGVTTGTSKTTFGPNESCTRAQAVTFLWRAAGCPAPKSTNNPFKDVKKSDYFYKAVLWAAGSGVTSGTSKTEFSPNDVCTRGQIVTFLWRSQGQKKVTASNPFTDVKKSDFYYNAVLWAVKNNVTAGTSKTTFEPNANCTRGQIVTFLYRAIVK